jgi:L-ascorbate metabolism protein UlaG (beta-lactamase superfamily)
MKIRWNGHSCFSIDSEEGIVVFDPYQDNSVPGLKPLNLQANLVLISHLHADHNAKEKVKLKEEKNIKVEKIMTYHDDKKGKLRGENIVHIVYLENMKIIHFGDIGCSLTEKQIELLKDCDVVMIPIGGYYTINSQEALTIIKQIKPRIIIPMHYRGKTFGYDEISTIEEFKKNSKNVIEYKDNWIEVNKETKNQTAILSIE